MVKSAFVNDKVKPKPTILVVDDISSNLFAIHDILEGRGFDVRVAASGKEALNAFSRIIIDVAVLDIEMPEMSGLELYEKMLEDPILKMMPVVFVTGDKDLATVTQAVDMGAAGYVVKPYEERILLQKISLAVQSAQIDQGALFLANKMKELQHLVSQGDPTRAHKLLAGIQADLFITPIAVMINKLKFALTQNNLSEEGELFLINNILEYSETKLPPYYTQLLTDQPFLLRI